MEKFIITPKEDKSVTMTIRIDRALQEEYNDLAAKTNRSRTSITRKFMLICCVIHFPCSFHLLFDFGQQKREAS